MVTPGGLVVLTDRRSAAGPLVEVVRSAVCGGAAWVVLREKDLGYAERAALAGALRSVVPPGRLIVAGPDPLGGDAVHLAGTDPVPSAVALVGRSWHGAENLSGVDYVTVSPVYPTSSKPGYGPALGVTGAAEMRAPVPWLALGGVDSPERAEECGAAGAAGVAVIGAVMRSPDPRRTAGELVAAFERGRSGRVDQAHPASPPSQGEPPLVSVAERSGPPLAPCGQRAGVDSGLLAGSGREVPR